MRIRILILCSFIGFFVSDLQGQHPVFRHYTVDDGLPSTEIYHVIQDSRGYIWLATNIGVSRFDGREFRNYGKEEGLPENTVFEVYEDYQGRVWFVSFPCQLSYYENDSIYQYIHNQGLARLSGKGLIPVKGSFSVNRDGSVFISFLSKGLYKIDPEGNIIHYYKNLINEGIDIIEDQGRLLMSQVGGSNLKENYINISTTGISIKLPVRKSKNFSYSNIYALMSLGKIFFAQNEFLTSISDKGIVTTRNMDDRVIYIQSDGKNLWIGTDKSGVLCFKDGDIDSMPICHYLGQYSVSSICMDKEGGNWFSTIENGLYYLPSEYFISYTTDDGLTNDKINDLALFRNQIILGTHDQFINTIKDQSINSLKVSDSKNGTIFKLLNDNDQLLWIGTNDYLFSFDGNSIIKYKNLYKGNDINKNTRKVFSIKDLFVDSRGRLIIGEANGISIFSNGLVKYSSFYSDNNILRVAKIVEVGTDDYLLGTADGLYQYSHGKILNMGSHNSLLQKRITDIAFSDVFEFMAYGTKGSGVIVQIGDKFYQITKSDGLSSNSVSSLLILGHYLWIGTNYGLNVFDIHKIGKRDFKINSFYKLHGLISNEINEIQGDENNIYVATNQGLTIFKYSSYKPSPIPPPIYINAFSIMKKKVKPQSGYRLKYNQNLITIDFIGISYRDGGNLRYKYRLKGQGDEWTYTTNNEVEYAYINSGDYLFEVVAINSDGIESLKPASIGFTILPPFWKTWWFMLLLLLLFSGLAFLFYLNRMKQISKEHKLQNDINWYRQEALAKQMDPHFVFNTLNSIQSFIIKNDRMASTQYLAKFSRLMRLILNNSQNPAVPVREEIAALTLYLELESLRFQQRFEFNLIVDEEIDTEKHAIPAFLIQPFLENSIWHGIMGIKEVGRIKIELTKHKNQISCMVEDNGIGRAKSQELKTTIQRAKQSYGTSLVESRLMLLNSLYNIDLKIIYTDLFNDDGTAAGTRVVINLPIIA